jgi:hypothetical protein
MESVEERKNREYAEKKAKEEKRIEEKSNKLNTEIALVSGNANSFIAEAFAKQKANSGVSAKEKSFSRRVLREVKRYENTGRASSWLASEFTKAQALRDITSKKAQEQPESVSPSAIGATIPIPNAPTNYEFKPIEFYPNLNSANTPNCTGLQLYIKNGDIWISAGLIAARPPLGFDPEDGKYIASAGSGYVWAEIQIIQETGEIISAGADGGGSVPDDTNTIFYYTLGYYEYNNNVPSVTNYGCGDLGVSLCRNWYVAEPPYFTVNFYR